MSTTAATGNELPQRLRRVTGSWNTVWERRTIELDELMSGGPPRDGIPSIDDPSFVPADRAAGWLDDHEPVIFFSLDKEGRTYPRAYPLQILILHEIVNDTVLGTPVLVTFCPLCNASVVFDRSEQRAGRRGDQRGTGCGIWGGVQGTCRWPGPHLRETG